MAARGKTPARVGVGAISLRALRLLSTAVVAEPSAPTQIHHIGPRCQATSSDTWTYENNLSHGQLTFMPVCVCVCVLVNSLMDARGFHNGKGRRPGEHGTVLLR